MDFKALKFSLLFELFLAVWLFHNANPNNAVTMKFTNYVCETLNSKIIQVHQCRLKAVKRDIVTLNFNASFLEQASRIRVEAALFKKANGYKPWLYKIDIDFCRFMRKGYNPIALFLVGDVLKFSNLNHSCPYQGPVLVQGWYLKPESYRFLFPTGEYLADTKWYFNGKLSFNGKLYFTYVEDL